MPKTSTATPPDQQAIAPDAEDPANQAVPSFPDRSSSQQAAQDEAADPASRDERVRRAAYDAFVRRGGEPGDEVQDWLDAEAQVDGRKE
jgi:hypothetical protein